MKIYYLITLCMVLAVGVANALGKAEEKAPIADSWLDKGRQIDVAIINGQVMLRRKVDVDAARQAAKDIAKGLDGVKNVKNDPGAVAPSARAAIEDKAETLTTHVKEDMAMESDLKQVDIAVQTKAGFVPLTGEVLDSMTCAHASWIAWQVPGEQAVKNGLTVKEKSEGLRKARPCS